MRAAFLGDNRIFSVFSDDDIRTISSSCELDKTVYNKNDVLSGAFPADTEYIFSTWGMPSFTIDEIQKYMHSLRCVFYGAGSVRGFAREFLDSGIRVFSAWGANAVPVAEFAFAQIILANKGYFRKMRCIRENKSFFGTQFAMPGNYGVKTGIIGAGQVGKLVLSRLKSIKNEVLLYDPCLSDGEACSLGAEKASLERLFSECNVVSNHAPNLPDNKKMIGYEHFASMKQDATFINTGRGAQIDENGLIQTAIERPDITFLLDVTDPEPPSECSPLYSLENVFLSPHIAGSIGNECYRMGHYMTEEFERYISETENLYEVTSEIFKTMA